MTSADGTAKLDLNSEWLAQLHQDFDSARISDDRMCEVLKSIAENYDYVACSHTSVALTAAEELGYFSSANNADRRKEGLVALLATASPCKFQRAVTVALGNDGWKQS